MFLVIITLLIVRSEVDGLLNAGVYAHNSGISQDQNPYVLNIGRARRRSRAADKVNDSVERLDGRRSDQMDGNHKNAVSSLSSYHHVDLLNKTDNDYKKQTTVEIKRQYDATEDISSLEGKEERLKFVGYILDESKKMKRPIEIDLRAKIRSDNEQEETSITGPEKPFERRTRPKLVERYFAELKSSNDQIQTVNDSGSVTLSTWSIILIVLSTFFLILTIIINFFVIRSCRRLVSESKVLKEKKAKVGNLKVSGDRIKRREETSRGENCMKKSDSEVINETEQHGSTDSKGEVPPLKYESRKRNTAGRESVGIKSLLTSFGVDPRILRRTSMDTSHVLPKQSYYSASMRKEASVRTKESSNRGSQSVI
ncbi:hypothetical protein AB6A40_010441 [Gnathostoma spinigerum]|uniref:Uncharacterized protein n=1 Tax=Gnathostoma spinigerum TaxID=75299 RepID=A0ABD6F2G7_9BILA